MVMVSPTALAQDDGEPAPAPELTAPPPAAAAPPTPSYSNVKNEWHEGDPVPPGYHGEKQVYVPLVMAGAIQLGTSWLTLGVPPGAILLAAGSESSCSGCTAAGATLLVPAVGPFLTMIVLGAYGEAQPVGYVLLTVDGLIQGAGLGMLIAGLVMQEDVLVRAPGGPDVVIKPMASVGAQGGVAGLSGSF